MGRLDTLLKQFFLNEVEAEELQAFLEAEHEAESFHYQFKDLDSIHRVEARDLEKLCQSVLDHQLTADFLTPIGETLNESEIFDWDDEIITEVCYFWLEPEENYALTPENIAQFIRWLSHEEPLPGL